MEFLLSARHSLAATVMREAPVRYARYRIRAAMCRYFKNGFGNFFIQIIAGKGFSVQFSIFQILKKKCLYPFTALPVITLHFMLKDNVRCFLKGFGEVWLREGLYHLFYVPGKVRHRAWFEPGEYHSFHIELSSRYLLRLSDKYPEINEALNRLRQHSSSGIQQHAAFITPRIRNIIEEMFQCPPEEPEKSVYLESRILQLLLLYVQDGPVQNVLLSHHDLGLMKDAVAYINAHLDYPHTIHSLSRQYGLSEIAFRRHFRQYTGKSFGSFLTDIRMNTAMHLLTATPLSIRKIAATVGYWELSNFDRAFRKKFGNSPHYYRK